MRHFKDLPGWVDFLIAIGILFFLGFATPLKGFIWVGVVILLLGILFQGLKIFSTSRKE